MRKSPATRMLTLVLMVSLSGCGSSDGGDGGASDAGATTPDAGSSNQLGRLCANDNPCPAEHTCVYLNAGNPDVGYCSPSCISAADCQDGYTGPSTGQLECFVPDQPNVCSIGCDTVADCPGELACVSPGGPVNICTTE